MNAIATLLDFAAGTTFIELSEAASLLILSVGLIAFAGVLRWILSKFDSVGKVPAENEAN